MRVASLVGLVLLIGGCGGGDRITQTRTVAPFDSLDIGDGVEVDVVPGDARGVQVHAGEDVMDRVETESSGGVLHVGIRDRGIVIGPDPLGDARVQVSSQTLEAVRIGGSGAVTLEDLDLEQLEIEVEGAGEVEASGTVERLNATLRGAANADLAELAASTAVVEVQGAADADLNVSDTLDVTIEGAADVSYRGNPDITQEIHGAGDIRREGT